MRDAPWLNLGLLLFFSFAGLWRTSMQLRDLVALGLLEPAYLRQRRMIQAVRFASLALCALAVLAYVRHVPFNNMTWVAGAVWTLFGLGYASKGQQAVKSAKPE
jgi:hypothetical protein